MKPFNNTEFTQNLKHISTICGVQVSDSHVQEVVRTTIKQYDYNEKEVFDYFKTILDTIISGGVDSFIDKMEWVKIYNNYINDNQFPGLGELLSDVEPTTPEEYKGWFLMGVEECGLDTEMVLTQLVIGYVGWSKFVDMIYRLADGETISTIPVADVISVKKPRAIKTRKTKKHISMRKLKKSGRAKSVIQYGLDGVELRRFDSVSGAERETKVKRTNIIASIKNNGTAGGYKWRYVGKSVVIESEPKTNQREKPVWVYLKDDGSLIGHYSSQKSAAYSLDVCECNISKALNGFTQTFVVKIDGQKRKCFCTYHPMSEISTIGDMVSVPETLASDIVGSVDIMSSSEETSTPTTEILSTQEDTTTSLVEKTSISFDEESFINRTHGIYTTLLDGQTFSSEKAKKVIETISVIEGVDWKHVTEYIFSMLKKSEPDFIRECQTNFDWESICLNVDGPLKDYIKNNNVNDHFKELFDMMSMVYGWNVEEILSEYIIDVYGWDKVLLLLVSISESHLVVNIYDTTTTSIITTTTLSTPTSVVNTHSIPTNPFPPDDKVVLEETKRA